MKRKVNSMGFTMIELLLVIAILGVLAVVVLIALNPVQQLARTRDAGRSSTVTQLGHSMEAYAVTHLGEYPAIGDCTGGDWIDGCLVEGGEIQVTPNEIAYSISGTGACATNEVSNICYASNGDNAVIYAAAEADSNTSQCDPQETYFVYSTAAGRGGLWCGGGEPAAGVTLGFVQ